MENERHARLGAGTILRLGELTKREAIVFVYLVSCKNKKSGKCNPFRSAIAAGTGLNKSHVSISIAGLESKGWIVETEDGSFAIVETDAVPKVTKSVTPKVTKSVTFEIPKVTKSVTEVTKSVTLLNKESKQTSNKQGTNKSAAAASEKPARATREKRKATRIPEPFPLTQEMLDWAKANTPEIEDIFFAHLDFVEYWTNLQTKKAIGSDWLLRWKKGMQLVVKWQRRDREQSRASSQVGKSPIPIADSYPDPIRRPAPILPAYVSRIWNGFRSAIAAELSPAVFSTWFDAVICDGVKERRLFLRSNSATIDWIGRYYAETVERAIKSVGVNRIVWENEDEGDNRRAAAV